MLHCQFNIVAKARLTVNEILQCFLYKDPEVLTRSFIILRPLLEYWFPVSSLCTIRDINKLESVRDDGALLKDLLY